MVEVGVQRERPRPTLNIEPKQSMWPTASTLSPDVYTNKIYLQGTAKAALQGKINPSRTD